MGYYADDGTWIRTRKRGRPRKYNPKRNMYCLRLTDEEADMLKDLTEDLSKNEQDVLRYLLHDYYCEHYYGKKYTGI